MTHTDHKVPPRASVWAVLGSFLILWITITTVAFTGGVNPAAFVISASALIPLVIFGTLIVLRDRWRRRR